MSRNKRKKEYLRTESGNAERFAAEYGTLVKFDHQRERWLLWDSLRHRWLEDRQSKVRVLMRETIRQQFRRVVDLPESDERKKEIRWSLRSESRNVLDASLELAKSIAPLGDDGEGWDANPWLLGVANGIVDLRTATLRQAKTDDHITLYSPVAFDRGAKCPHFEKFIFEVCNGDKELVGFIQRAMGYTLTGLSDEQCLFLCHGSGANGKSTLLGIVHHILGDYAVNVPFSALEKQGRSNITNDLAMLSGRRFATALETGEDVQLNEARIKTITGGDQITARYLYHEHFTFNPTHKLWLAVNHKPRILDESEGMWRRMRLIPFEKQFSGENRDNKLSDKLKAEAPGILAWAVEGALQWQKEGLGQPPSVAKATAAYRKESDHLAGFLDECCLRLPARGVPVAALWKRYLQWAEDNEEPTLSRRAFSDRMQRAGYRKGRSGHGGTRVWVGLTLADRVTSADTISNDSSIAKSI